MHPVTDTLQRPLRDLRISVTDRCNLRCTYCMPREVFGKGFIFLQRVELLSFEEITRVARQFVELGVRKIRLSGGEPLLVPLLEEVVAATAALQPRPGRGPRSRRCGPRGCWRRWAWPARGRRRWCGLNRMARRRWRSCSA